MFIQDEFPYSEGFANIEEIVNKNDVYQKGAILEKTFNNNSLFT